MDSVFKSTHPSAVECFAKAEHAREEWTEALIAFLEPFGDVVTDGRAIVRGPRSFTTFVGIRPERKGQRSPVDGWRTDSKSGYWVPALKTPEGRQARDAIRKIGNLKRPLSYLNAETGMPEVEFGEHTMHQPAYVEHDGTVWVKWGCEVEMREAMEPYWTRVPLSEFYGLVEAGHNPFHREPETAEAAS